MIRIQHFSYQIPGPLQEAGRVSIPAATEEEGRRRVIANRHPDRRADPLVYEGASCVESWPARVHHPVSSIHQPLPPSVTPMNRCPAHQEYALTGVHQCSRLSCHSGPCDFGDYASRREGQWTRELNEARENIERKLRECIQIPDPTPPAMRSDDYTFLRSPQEEAYAGLDTWLPSSAAPGSLFGLNRSDPPVRLRDDYRVPCDRCGSTRKDPEHEGPCGECCQDPCAYCAGGKNWVCRKCDPSAFPEDNQ